MFFLLVVFNSQREDQKPLESSGDWYSSVTTTEGVIKMKRRDKIRQVQLAYMAAGLNNNLRADGTVGKEAIKAIQERRSRQIEISEDVINRIILAHMCLGLNDNLAAKGQAGAGLWNAQELFLGLAGHEDHED